MSQSSGSIAIIGLGPKDVLGRFGVFLVRRNGETVGLAIREFLGWSGYNLDGELLIKSARRTPVTDLLAGLR